MNVMRSLFFAVVLCLSASVAHADDGILVIGDSTSIGAMPYLQKLMPCVHHNPGNGRDTTNIIAKLPRWLFGKNYRLIYVNSGLWDVARRIPTPDNPWRLDPTDEAPVSVPLASYKLNLNVIAAYIHGFEPDAIIIFATSTDVPADSDGRKPADLRRYNTAMKNVMADLGIEVDDRYAFMLPYAYLHDTRTSNKVHYYPAGYQVMAAHEARVFQRHGGC